MTEDGRERRSSSRGFSVAAIGARWAVIVALGLVSYVLSSGWWEWAIFAGLIRQEVGDAVTPMLYAPIQWYTNNDWPGTDVYWRYLDWCARRGQG
jgi:hypothetical protein